MNNSGVDIIGVLISFIFLIGIYLWISLAVAAVLGKAGRPTWPAWIPVYNVMSLFQLAGSSPWLGLLTLLGPLQILVWGFLGYKLNPRFGLAPAWAVLSAFVPAVWLSILGWGSARWLGEDASAQQTSAWPGDAGGIDALFGTPAAPAAVGYDANGYPLAPTPAVDTQGAGWGTPAGAAPAWLATPDPAVNAAEQTVATNWAATPAAAAWPAAENEGWPVPAAPADDGGAWPAPGDAAPAWPAPAAPAWAAPVAPAAPSWGAPTATDASTPAPAWDAAPAPVWDAADAEALANTDTDARPWAPPERSTPPPTAAWAPAAAPVTAAVPDAPATDESPVISSPYAPPVEPISAEPTYVAAAPAVVDESSGARSGATRMKEDSEVVAQARAAFSAPDAEVPVSAPADESAGPIVVAGASGVLPGVVPPPPVPPLTGAPGRGGAAATVGEYHPRLRRDRLDAEDLELSAEVSAIAGAPSAGEPRSAMASVSAQTLDSAPEIDDDIEETMLAARRRPVWRLQLPMSTRPVDVTAECVVLGRRPAASDGPAGAQLIPVADGTRTVSKTHARLDLVDGAWTVTDLGSTNGVVLIGDNGEETELAAHATAVLTERFLLGDAELRLTSQTA